MIRSQLPWSPGAQGPTSRHGWRDEFRWDCPPATSSGEAAHQHAPSAAGPSISSTSNVTFACEAAVSLVPGDVRITIVVPSRP